MKKLLSLLISCLFLLQAEGQLLGNRDSTFSVLANAIVPRNYVLYLYNKGKLISTFSGGDTVRLPGLFGSRSVKQADPLLHCFIRSCPQNLGAKTKCLTCVESNRP